QAEDGIRDKLVTGVQTCALPISENVFVTVAKTGGVQEERPVVIGLSDGNFAEVISGLTAGEQVIVRKNEADSKWRQQQQGGQGRSEERRVGKEGRRAGWQEG